MAAVAPWRQDAVARAAVDSSVIVVIVAVADASSGKKEVKYPLYVCGAVLFIRLQPISTCGSATYVQRAIVRAQG